MTEQHFKTVVLEQLKQARAKRGGQPAGLAESLKEQARVQRVLTLSLEAGPKTIPEVAQETGISSQALLWHLAAIRKYGQLLDGPKRGAYPSYQLSPKEAR